MKNGYAVLTSVLVVAAVATAAVIFVPLFSVSQLRNSQLHSSTFKVQNLVEGCIEESIWQILTNEVLPTTLTLPEITCTSNLTSQTGSQWEYVVSGTIESITVSFDVIIDTGNPSLIVKWELE
jgi:hypothetical protein